ncbi:hypothetical protein ACH3XW_41050 [Acanthocheilonema viteae]
MIDTLGMTILHKLKCKLTIGKLIITDPEKVCSRSSKKIGIFAEDGAIGSEILSIYKYNTVCDCRKYAYMHI